MESKTRHLLFALGASAVLLGTLVLFAIIVEIIRERNVVIGYPNGKLYYIDNKSFVQTEMTNLTDLCHPYAITSSGTLFINQRKLLTVPLQGQLWCVWKRDTFFVGSSERVYQVIPALKNQSWSLPGARYVGWKDNQWIISRDEPFKINQSKEIRIRDGYLIESPLSQRWVGKNAITLDWSSI